MKKNIVLALGLLTTVSLQAGGGENESKVSKETSISGLQKFFKCGDSVRLKQEVKFCFNGQENVDSWKESCTNVRKYRVDQHVERRNLAIQIKSELDGLKSTQEAERMVVNHGLLSLAKSTNREAQFESPEVAICKDTQKCSKLASELEAFTKKKAHGPITMYKYMVEEGRKNMLPQLTDDFDENFKNLK